MRGRDGSPPVPASLPGISMIMQKMLTLFRSLGLILRMATEESKETIKSSFHSKGTKIPLDAVGVGRPRAKLDIKFPFSTKFFFVIKCCGGRSVHEQAVPAHGSVFPKVFANSKHRASGNRQVATTNGNTASASFLTRICSEHPFMGARANTGFNTPLREVGIFILKWNCDLQKYSSTFLF